MPYCPTCGMETAEGQTRCPECGSLLATPPDDRTGSTRWVLDLAVGFVAGLLALVVGFVMTLVLSDIDENRELVEEVLDSNGPAGVALSELLPEWYHVTGWVFLENHHVDVSVSVGEVFGGGAWVSEYAETLLPTASELQVLPPVLLITAGTLVALRRTRRSPADAALAGATVVAGYLPGIAVVAYAAAFEVVVIGDIVLLEVAPDFGRAILIAGIVYPLLFGGIGGLVAFVLGRSLPVWDR